MKIWKIRKMQQICKFEWKSIETAEKEVIIQFANKLQMQIKCKWR